MRPRFRIVESRAGVPTTTFAPRLRSTNCTVVATIRRRWFSTFDSEVGVRPYRLNSSATWKRQLPCRAQHQRLVAFAGLVSSSTGS